MVTLIDRPDHMAHWANAQRRGGATIGLVPTMGALHEGHLALIDAAVARAERVVVSIFVNPLQFGEPSDFEHYPRPLDDDIAACERHGVTVVYAPIAATMYPHGFATTVHVAGITDPMEGAARPFHFDGVTTVVAKLIAATRPDIAVFGEKDYQQLAVVRRLVADLDLGVDIVAHPTVREADGLALSSRNQRLSDNERAAARCVPAALTAATERAAAPLATPGDAVDAATRVIGDEPLAVLDYATVFDAHSLHVLDTSATFDAERVGCGRTRMAIAVRIGGVRLIDNIDLFDNIDLLDDDQVQR